MTQQQIDKSKEPTPVEIAKQKIYKEMGVSDDEYALICDILKRKPNYNEIGVFSVMWSEHCSYKNSRHLLKRFPTSGQHVLMGPGEGAGVVDIGDEQAIVFKIESHNSPSAVEPYQGAATGVGGIMRDIFSMGARPIASMNSLRFGNLENPRVKYLFENVVAGIAGYGNSIGVPTVGGEVQFDPSYEGNPLVNAMNVGLIDHANIQRGIAAGVGNPVFYVGPATGRDGIHGATFSSKELSDGEEAERPAVQVGDPYMEKLVMEACLELIETGIVIGIQDMGAAGLTCSSAEMASKGDTGIELYLDQVPQREEGMTAYEMLLSESQERMLFVVEPQHEQKVKEIFQRWGVLCEIVGKVTDDGDLKVFHHGEIVAQLPVKPLTDDCPMYQKPTKVPAYYEEMASIDPTAEAEVTDLHDALLRVLASPTVASKEWVYSQYDHMAGNSTIVPPGSDAAVVHIKGTRKAIAMSTDCNGRYVYLDPEVGGRIAVAEAARNVVCSGAEPLAITDNLNFGSPENPEVFWQFEQAVNGMAEACRELEAPVIGGNVSLYNESDLGAIYPTPVVGLVGLVKDLDHITTQSFKNEGDIILLLGDTQAEMGGSEFQFVLHGKTEGRPPSIDLQKEKVLLDELLRSIQAGQIESAHDLSDGGCAVAIAESCMSGSIGAAIDWETSLRPDHALFSESQSRILISVNPANVSEVTAHFAGAGVPVTKLGVVGGANLQISLNGEQKLIAPISELTQTWKGAIPCLMK